MRLRNSSKVAIHHLNQNPSHLWAPTYGEHLETMADRADQMKQSVDLHLDLAGTQEKIEKLRDRVAGIDS